MRFLCAKGQRRLCEAANIGDPPGLYRVGGHPYWGSLWIGQMLRYLGIMNECIPPVKVEQHGPCHSVRVREEGLLMRLVFGAAFEEESHQGLDWYSDKQ